MNFFTMLNQVEQAAAVNLQTAKTQAFRALEVEPQEDEEAKKPVRKSTKQKPTEGAGADNIEQPETQPEQPEQAAGSEEE